jgi:hypothetical protein
MNTKQRIIAAVAIFAILGVLAFLGWSHQNRHLAGGQRADTLTVNVTSPEDRGPGSLREALYIVDGANRPATVLIRTARIALKSPLPPLVNVHGVRIVGQTAGAEIDGQELPAGAMLDVAAANTSLESVALRHCPAAGILLRATHFHLQSAIVESCDVAVDVAENAGDLLLEHNRFADDRVGVRFAGASPRAVVVGNSFLHNKDAGLWAVRATPDDPRGGPITVRENHFTGNRSGIVAGNVALLAERNEFDQQSDAAVQLVGAGAVIRSNTINGGAATGIAVDNVHGALIDANELEHVAAYAIMVRGSADVTVRGNRIHNCGYGLAFVLGDAHSPSIAVDNTIIEPRFNGIDVIGDSPVLRRNRVLGPHAFALHVVNYRPPGGEEVRAQPLLEGNNFRADQLQVASDAARTRDAGRQ